MALTVPLPFPALGLKSVLVASDFSEASEKPLRHAITIARHFHAKLYLAHVVSSIGFAIAGENALVLAADAARRDVAQLERNLVERGAFDGLSHEFIVREGDLWQELQAIIHAKEVELIVVGTHARQGLQRFMLGSVAEQIFREAGNLVLTVGPHNQPDVSLDLNGQLRTFLFPTDLSDASAHALPYAVMFANHFRAKLVLLHVDPVMPISESFSWSTAPDNFQLIFENARQKTLQLLRDFVAASAPHSPMPELLVEFGKHDEQILRVAHSLKTNLIIMGLNHSNHGRAISHLPQTTAYKVATRAHCSALTVRY